MKKQARTPMVGIYWEYKGDIIAFPFPMNNKSMNERGFYDSPKDHISVWPRVQQMHPELKLKEYESIPRGRVVAKPGGGSFNLFVPPDKIKDKVFISNVMRQFDLPPRATNIETDEHYTTQDGPSPFIEDPWDDDYDPDISDMYDE